MSRELRDPVDGYDPSTGAYPRGFGPGSRTDSLAQDARFDSGLAFPQATVPAAVLPSEDKASPWGGLRTLAVSLRSVVRGDGFRNTLTGLGDPTRDKTFGGKFNGPDFVNAFFTGWECQERWRGSGLGHRIIEKG